MNAKRVVDIGAAYDGFAKTLVAFDPKVEITMVDLAFPKGLKKNSPQIYQLGADAANMDALKTDSIDLVCMHNAFEHFAGNSDKECLREISRILRPGGVALITPFFFAERHSVTFSPASSFLFDRSDYFAKIARSEMKEFNARIDFNGKIVSPFARRYDMRTTMSRIIETTPDLDIKLKKCSFLESAMTQEHSLKGYPAMKIDPRLYNNSHFNYLEFTKRHPNASSI